MRKVFLQEEKTAVEKEAERGSMTGFRLLSNRSKEVRAAYRYIPIDRFQNPIRSIRE